MPKYLVVMKSESRPKSSQAGAGPSPEQMQQMFAAYKAWMAQYKDQIVDMGDKLLPGGRVLTMSASGLSDGPFVEAKEIIGGFMIISAKDEAGAVEVVRACPAVQMPGAVLEIREMAGAKM
ncbi:MAG: YciI family protein [Myxococcales bacterium]|nr:YciI family protein [Myxococcales bacterium]